MDAPVASLLIEGVWLMLMGMTIVFVFLFLLVGLLLSMSWAIRRWGPVEPVAAVAQRQGVPAAIGTDAPIAAVIAAAVQAHRRRSQR
jgi:oxaloacetate decarboxylase gamma subunit